MRAHVVLDGRIANTIEVESLDVLPNLISAETGGRIGDLWDGRNFAESTSAQVPSAVSMRQARLALLGDGLLDSVNAAIAAMPGPDGDASRIEWEYAQDVRRDSPLVLSLSGALGMTAAQIDDLFVLADTL